MFEIAGVSEEVAREALRLASHKPVSYTHLDVYKRQEKTSRPFLRHREFLWQEGHTMHCLLYTSRCV